MPKEPFAPLLTIVLAARSRAISARSICHGARFDAAALDILREIVAADPDVTLVVSEGVVKLGGPDEASLDRAVDIFRNRCEAPFAIGAPQVGYVEAALKTIETDYTFKRHDVVADHMFARLKLVVAPTLGGFAFASIAVGEAVPGMYVPAVAEAIGDIARAGPCAGYPVVATRVTLVDGACHASDSNAEAFARAARGGFCEALVEGGGVLEPIMRLEVLAPPDDTGGVAGDIISRRGEIVEHAIRGDRLATTATVPLANLLGYTHELRGLTQGHGRHTMSFERYDPVPPPPRVPPPALAAGLRR